MTKIASTRNYTFITIFTLDSHEGNQQMMHAHT